MVVRFSHKSNPEISLKFRDFFISSIMKQDFYISTDKSKLDISLIHDFLSNRSYWAQGRTRETIEKSINNSICFGIYNQDEKQAGFARVATDYAIFAYIMDVFIIETERGKGLGKLLIQSIMEHPELSKLRRIMLATQDAHTLYEQYGFRQIENPENFMEIVRK